MSVKQLLQIKKIDRRVKVIVWDPILEFHRHYELWDDIPSRITNTLSPKERIELRAVQLVNGF